MRAMQFFLHQEMPPETEARAIGDELVQCFGVSEDKVNKLVDLFRDADYPTAARAMPLTRGEADQIQKASGLDAQEWASLCICLGSVSSPHTFGPTPVASTLLGGVFPQSLEDPPPKDELVKSTKGGARTLCAEELTERRTLLVEGSYGPGLALDMYKNGTRPIAGNVRQAVVKEVCYVLAHFVERVASCVTVLHVCASHFEQDVPSAAQVFDVCGDLYPDSVERGVILPAIEKYIGPPSAGKHWYSWKDEGAKKHKGSAISDLEKARRDPTAWGVSAKCVPGRMRPSRPVRRAQAPAVDGGKGNAGGGEGDGVKGNAGGGEGDGGRGDKDGGESESGDGIGKGDGDGDGDGDLFGDGGDDDLIDLQGEAALLTKCKALEQAVEEARTKKLKEAAEIKAAKKAAKEVAKEAAKTAKTAKTATAKEGTATGKPLEESSAGNSNKKKRKAEEEPDDEEVS